MWCAVCRPHRSMWCSAGQWTNNRYRVRRLRCWNVVRGGSNIRCYRREQGQHMQTTPHMFGGTVDKGYRNYHNQTVCVSCDTRTWREVAPTSTAIAEIKEAMCKPHRICSAGQWTKSTGTRTKDTVCVDCDVGTWREVAPISSANAEHKQVASDPTNGGLRPLTS